MSEGKCPLCGSSSFFVKNLEDEYETYEFEMQERGVVFDQTIPDGERPEIDSKTSTYCNRCSWHGPFGEIEGKEKGSRPV